jgi:hypothetical protein
MHPALKLSLDSFELRNHSLFRSDPPYGEGAALVAFHAVPGNTTQLRIFKLRVCRLWQSVLVRRSQRAPMRWERLTPILNRWIPPPRVLHPIPMPASTPLILRKSRMRRRARTDLRGGQSVMIVPTATTILI